MHYPNPRSVSAVQHQHRWEGIAYPDLVTFPTLDTKCERDLIHVSHAIIGSISSITAVEVTRCREGRGNNVPPVGHDQIRLKTARSRE